MSFLDEPKRQVRKLEMEIGNKLNSLESMDVSEGNEHNLEIAKNLIEETQNLLLSLSETNEILTKGGYTLATHHRSKFQDLNQEFSRLRDKIKQQWDRYQLFQGANQTGTEGSEGLDHLIRERSSLMSGKATLEGLVEQAHIVTNNFQEQERRLGNADVRVRDSTTQFTDIDSLLGRIKWQKYKNTYLTALCYATGFIFFFIYWWNS